MSDGFLYFIQEEGTGRIKIGFSEKHPKGRLKDIQTGNSNKLDLMGYIEGTYEDENRLHREFSEERIRNENEWFESSPRLKERIKELLNEAIEEKKSGIEILNRETIILEEDGFWGPGLSQDGEKKERRYEGELKDGEPNGHGTLTYHPSGTKYIGEFKDGNSHGKGTITVKRIGFMYEGEWKDGKRYGQGIFTEKMEISMLVSSRKDGSMVKEHGLILME